MIHSTHTHTPTHTFFGWKIGHLGIQVHSSCKLSQSSGSCHIPSPKSLATSWKALTQIQ